MTKPLSNVDIPTSDSRNLGKTPSSSIEEEIHALRAEIVTESIIKPPSSTCFLTMTGNNTNFSYNVSKTLYKDSWVLDSTTDHITLSSSLLESYVSLFGNHFTVVNEICIPISGRGNVSLLPPLSLKDVFYVPKLSNNLISIQKLTDDLNCFVTFPTHCVSYDLATGRTIRTIKEKGRLYGFNNFKAKDSINT